MPVRVHSIHVVCTVTRRLLVVGTPSSETPGSVLYSTNVMGYQQKQLRVTRTSLYAYRIPVCSLGIMDKAMFGLRNAN